MRNEKGQFIKGFKRTPEMNVKILLKQRGRKHSDETKRKISKKNIGHFVSEKTKKAISFSNINRTVSEETRKKMRNNRLGKKLSLETRLRMSNATKGKKKTITEKVKEANRKKSGENSLLWKGGITPLVKKIRACFNMRQWRSDVFTRDNFTCQECGEKSGNGHSVYLEAHHIKRLHIIREEYNIKTLEEALACDELWNINNGITLCDKCHDKTRKLDNKKI